MSKAMRLAVAIRRMQIRRRVAEEEEGAAREARRQAQHERTLIRRETTGRLARARIRACERHPSVFAVRQLVRIVRDAEIPTAQRVEAASTLLRWGE
jgi:hypothetical protein